MTTTYTDAQIEAIAAKLADGISIEHWRPSPLKMGSDMLRKLLSERQAAMQGQGGEFPEDSLAQQLKHAKTDAWAWQMTAKGFNPTKSPKWFVITGMNLQENPILVFTDRGFAEQFCAHNPSEHGYEIYAAIDACQPPQPVRSVSDEYVRDAERYRWLRGRNVGDGRLYNVIHDDAHPGYQGFKYEGELDQAIDAAIAQEKQS